MSKLALGGVLERLGAPVAEVSSQSRTLADMGFLRAVVAVSPEAVDETGRVPMHLVPMVLADAGVELPVGEHIAIVPAPPELATDEVPWTPYMFAVLGFPGDAVAVQMAQDRAIEVA